MTLMEFEGIESPGKASPRVESILVRSVAIERIELLALSAYKIDAVDGGLASSWLKYLLSTSGMLCNTPSRQLGTLLGG